jgi:hypothetical protein
MMKKLTFAYLLCILIIPCYARTITINADGTGDYPTIQSAINSAEDGDTIIVQQGTYEEDICFLGKNIVLTSISPTDYNIVSSTIIGYNGGYLTFCGTEDPNCVLSGFTVNSVIYGMGGDLCPGGGDKHTRATISHCLFQGNKESCGTVIYGCDGMISNCLIADNNVRFCVCLCPAIDACYGIIRNCTIVNSPYGVEIGVYNNGITTVENCIIYHEGESMWPQIMVYPQATLNISYTFLQDDLSTAWGTVNWGPGNIIGADPCFIRIGCWDVNQHGTLLQGDYHLLEDSLCINAGDPNYLYDPNETDLDGNERVAQDRIDMGAYEYQPPIQALLNITPKRLNYSSRGKWLKMRITLPGEIGPEQLENPVPLDIDWPFPHACIPTYAPIVSRGKSPVTIELEFDRRSILDALGFSHCEQNDIEYAECEIFVSGSLNDGRTFVAVDTIILPGCNDN